MQRLRAQPSVRAVNGTAPSATFVCLDNIFQGKQGSNAKSPGDSTGTGERASEHAQRYTLQRYVGLEHNEVDAPETSHQAGAHFNGAKQREQTDGVCVLSHGYMHHISLLCHALL